MRGWKSADQLPELLGQLLAELEQLGLGGGVLGAAPPEFGAPGGACEAGIDPDLADELAEARLVEMLLDE